MNIRNYPPAKVLNLARGGLIIRYMTNTYRMTALAQGSERIDFPEGAPEWAARYRAIRQFIDNGESMSQCTIARRSKGRLTQQYLSQFESGQIGEPGLEKLRAISEAHSFSFLMWFIAPDQWHEWLSMNSAPQPGGIVARLEPDDVDVLNDLAAHLEHIRRDIYRNEK